MSKFIATCKHPDGCENPPITKGWCKAHYMRIRRHGDPGPADLLRKKQGKCQHPSGECERPAYQHGYCSMHLTRLYKKGNLGPAKAIRRCKIVHDPVPEGMKFCRECETTQPIENFHTQNSSPDKKQSVCKACQSLQNFARNTGYDISELRLFKESSNACEICGTNEDLVIDHCHKTNGLRGILCGKCNTGIGMLGDDIETVKKALQYLEGRARLIQE